MRHWLVRDADGYFASPSFWLVIAETEEQARLSLNAAMEVEGLDPGKGLTMEEIDASLPAVHKLTAGEC